MSDLFAQTATKTDYTAADIEVLEGLEPVRRRPGMYIGGTDERALHHLAAEVLDNSMDEAVAGHASRIDMELDEDGKLTIRDNGRGIPIDPHPKFPDKSALEVILTTLHSGGKFAGKAYATAGGLHGVGISVVNALSDYLLVEVARDRQLYAQVYKRGAPLTAIEKKGAVSNRRGTSVTFHPDPEIFGEGAKFKPSRLYRLARSKAYLYRGVEIRWKCAPSLLAGSETTPAEATLHFPGGLADFLTASLEGKDLVVPQAFAGRAKLTDDRGEVEWAVTWQLEEDAIVQSYCNTIPTPEGGTHEAGLRSAITKGIRAYGEMTNNRRVAQVTSEDVFSGCFALLSLFIRDPQFSGQTKEKLATAEATRLVELAIKDHFDHWLHDEPTAAKILLDYVIEKAEDRLRRRQQKEVNRKTATRKLRLPGKLADCSRDEAEGTELFLVEGDSAGGSAKQARSRENQAILPLRGKILNVASATVDKLRQNQELQDLLLALGVGTGSQYKEADLRYEKVIIMTDADVDGAHIASLLITFFYRELPNLIRQGHLFLAQPPLYRLTQGGKSLYARDDAHKEALIKSQFKTGSKVDISRFKGLGEMPPAQLKETTMAPKNRILLRVALEQAEEIATAQLVESLMGRKPELRFQYIQDNASAVTEVDI